MNNSKTQFRDLGRPDAPTISDVRHLDGRGALYLLALVQARHARTRVTPAVEGTHSVLAVLDALGVVRVEPEAGPDSYTIDGDKIAWSYTWPHVLFEELEVRLKDYLQSEAQEPPYAEMWLRVWQELVQQDVTAYLRHQLRIHQFPDFFLVELARLLMLYDSSYSLGHWRYACWAAVRSMASISLQHPGKERSFVPEWGVNRKDVFRPVFAQPARDLVDPLQQRVFGLLLVERGGDVLALFFVPVARATHPGTDLLVG